MSETTSTTRITQVGVAMVPVTDVDAAIDFYVEKLGFEKRSDTPYGDGQRWVEVAPAGAATRVALVPPTDDAPPGGPARVAFATNDVDADHADLKARGVDVDDEVMRMGDPVPPMFWFRDPDGNSLLIVEDPSA
jgi:catechol 2,3-dioxygenase-like lactoylglutathione lyase family enzyme